MSQREKIYDVMVVGSGFAGTAAAYFAARKGLAVVQTGAAGGLDFSSGLIDLMGVHPFEDGTCWENPWEAIEALIQDRPQHPYALMSQAEIFEAIESFTAFLGENGLPYSGTEKNSYLMTAAGTIKRTYRVPQTAFAGVTAFQEKAPTLIVSFEGLKGFSSQQIVQVRKKNWPHLQGVRVALPEGKGQLFPENIAWKLSDARNRERLVESLHPFLDGIEYIGFPAVLGVQAPCDVVAHLESLTGKRVFEIPIMPPALGGARIRAVCDRAFPALGVDRMPQKIVSEATIEQDKISFVVGKGNGAVLVNAKTAIVATGRFFSKGLLAERGRVVEPLFDMSVAQPQTRSDWHRETFFCKSGHPINQAGIEVDQFMRPLDKAGKPLERIFAAGSLLAHHDWMRMKCGGGMALATASKAVASLIAKKFD